MMARRLALLTVLLGVPAAAAMPARGTAQEEQSGETVQVVAENRASADVSVYVRQSGHMVPLGVLAPSEEETWPLPPTFLESGEEIHLVADPVGRNDWFESEPLSLRPESELQLIIEENLSSSSVSVSG